LRDDIERLYRALGPGLLAYGRCILGSRPAAEDALHQVFLKLVSGAVPMPQDPRPYLYRALRNVALNLRRGEIRASERRSAGPLFEAPPELHEGRIVLEAALGELPEEQRQVVLLRVWGEMTIEEAAEVLCVSPNTVASRYRYALAKLREQLHPFFER
jgi:RNA polymerase sigma-70 factor (ECF subfamily)